MIEFEFKEYKKLRRCINIAFYLSKVEHDQSVGKKGIVVDTIEQLLIEVDRSIEIDLVPKQCSYIEDSINDFLDRSDIKQGRSPTYKIIYEWHKAFSNKYLGYGKNLQAHPRKINMLSFFVLQNRIIQAAVQKFNPNLEITLSNAWTIYSNIYYDLFHKKIKIKGDDETLKLFIPLMWDGFDPNSTKDQILLYSEMISRSDKDGFIPFSYLNEIRSAAGLHKDLEQFIAALIPLAKNSDDRLISFSDEPMGFKTYSVKENDGIIYYIYCPSKKLFFDTSLTKEDLFFISVLFTFSEGGKILLPPLFFSEIFKIDEKKMLRISEKMIKKGLMEYIKGEPPIIKF